MSGRILIADNVATNRIILKVKLSAASYDVWQVETALALLKLTAQDQPDLIMIDADLPDCDGFEACRKLKRDPKLASIPVIIMTANYDRNIRLKALRAGAEEILPKPFDDDLLLARLRNLLRVRGMEEELERREGTAAEFGFNEPGVSFTTRAHVALVKGPTDVSPDWEQAIANRLGAEVSVFDERTLLEQIVQQKKIPDVIVLPANMTKGKGGLTLIAELRCRAETRYCAIIMGYAASDKSIAVAALDVGANDLLAAESLPEEVTLRIAAQLKRKRNSDRLRKTLENGLQLALTDPLTGLYNRRYAYPHTAKIAARAEETGNPFALMVLDLDRFKRINDTYGHSAGDAVLVEVARRLRDNLRNVDLLARIGGEEFLVVMPETDLKAASNTAERLRRVIEEGTIFVAPDCDEVAVTVSIGVSLGGLATTVELPVQKIFDRADKALLGSKSQGRNQVTFGQSAA